MAIADLERWFPSLARDGYRKTSDESIEYNCIAFAGDDDTEMWDPDETSGRYWPQDGVPRGLSLENFVKLYEVECGYKPCDNGHLEEGFEKIAIFWNFNPATRTNEVSHA